MSDSESSSLEYIEDPYIPKLDNAATPSLDTHTATNILQSSTIDVSLSSFVPTTNTTTQRENSKHCCPSANWIDDDNYSDAITETDIYLRHLTLDEIFYDVDSDYINQLELQAVETEFIANKLANQMPSTSIAKRFRLKFFTKHRNMRDVKVTFIDFSKPYLARISSNENYKRFLNIGSTGSNNCNQENCYNTHNNRNNHNNNNNNSSNNNNTNANRNDTDNVNKHSGAPSPVASVASADIAAEFAALTGEEQERQRAEWSQELARVEEEINTLRTVLASKTRHASDLKRKLGITVWKEITDDMNQGLKSVKESSVYQSVEQSVGNLTKAVHDAPIFQRTESVLKSTGEKTASVFGSITSGISSKFTQMKNSESMRSIEEKMGSAYENVKNLNRVKSWHPLN